MFANWRYRGIDPFEYMNSASTPLPANRERIEAFMDGCARFAAATEEGTTDVIEGIVKAFAKGSGKNRSRSRR